MEGCKMGGMEGGVNAIRTWRREIRRVESRLFARVRCHVGENEESSVEEI